MNIKIQQWMNWILYDELIEGKINAPKHLLGNHDYGEGQMIAAYKPHSVSCKVIAPTGNAEYEMEKIDEHGFYALYLPKKKFNGSKYQLVTNYEDGSMVVSADPYSFNAQITDYDIYLFSEGNHWDIYKKLGRTVTSFEGEGLINGKTMILYSVITRLELSEFKEIVTRDDRQAFVTVLDVSEIIGRHVKKLPDNVVYDK